MGQVLVRNLDDDVLASLRTKADLNGRSLEAELRQILTEAAELTAAEKVALSRKLRAGVKPSTVNSTDVIRAFRDSR